MNSIVQNQKDQIRELLDAAASVGIIVGQNQNIDTVGAALALFLVLRNEGKNVQIVSRREPQVEVANLVGIDKISNSFDGNTKILTISVPNLNDEIEKVSYNIEGNKLKVNLFAEEKGISFSERDIEYIKKGSSPSLIIGVGVSSDEELTSLVELASVKTILIDKGNMSGLMGDVMLVDPAFSSVSEIVTQLIMDLSMVDMDAFQNLMDGIAYATRNFTSPNTSAFAFEAAGFLLQNGARRRERERNDRPRRDNFPQESHFLGGRPNRNQRQNRQNQNQNRNRQYQNQNQNQNVSRNAQNVNNDYKSVPSEPKLDDIDQNSFNANTLPNDFDNNFPSQDVNFDSGDDLAPKPITGVDDSLPSDIPDDWFLPKVFKGSKKNNN